ncbi:polyphenol oxidase, chloroplastic-like [Malania oleifera]|uniref:polyphenol oxidase, chloroplastic-like n=1 Tax=Malania oleifera TaxID=397392 RepID=UPI0025AE31BB|nr:polyphenol oxidase, chloroplastic-like [Malania oleifera]
MATSLSPPIATTIPTAFSCPFHKSLHASTLAKPNNPHARKLSCKATSSNGDQNPSHPLDNYKLQRRNILIALGGLSGATPFAFASPIAPPDLTQCGAPELPEGAMPTNCCPPGSATITDFQLPPPSSALRVRPAAHLVDDEYVTKYTKAVELMKALPDDDPRSFKQQANVHCAYCDGAYQQVGFPSLDLQVHNSWLFFPFHRFYLYFHEKILGKLIGDPTFVLPFWNWDSPPGMQMPAMYSNPKSPLYDALRDASHWPPSVVDLAFNGKDTTASTKDLVASNLSVMYRQMVSNGKNASLFLGNPYRAGDEPDPGAGSIENFPHGPVHVWCGDRTQPNLEDMGNFYSAGRDPIFYAHHANVDRMWTVWKGLGGKRADFTDSDWLDSGFLFYDENAQLVRVKVRDCLDTKKMGYVYQDVDIPWLGSRPAPRRARAAATLGFNTTGEAKAAETSKHKHGDGGSSGFPKTLDKIVRVVVRRPRRRRSKKEKEEEEEVLVIENIEVERDVYVKFDVYVNDEEVGEGGRQPGAAEFAGSFVSVPHKHKHKHKKRMRTGLRLGISDVLEDLGAEEDESVVVTLVPRNGGGIVTIGGIKIELAS